MLCLDCPKRPNCTKLCPQVKKILKQSGIYSASWIRPEISTNKRKEGKGKWREIPFASLITTLFMV